MKLNKDFSPFFLFIAFIFIYYWGSFSMVPFGDCMGFIVDIEKGNFIFSTSVYAHFLFSNSLILLKKIFPFVESIEIGRWFTIFFGALSVSILYKIILEVTLNRWASFIGALLLGFSFTFWRNAEIVEIYTFNTFLTGIFILYSIKFIKHQRDRYLLIASFVLGISLWNHIQNILMIPGLLFLMFHCRNRDLILKSALVFLLFLGGLFLIPILKEEPLNIVFKSVNSSHQINFNNFLKDLLKSAFFLIYNFWHFVLFGITGIVLLLKKNLKLSLFLLLLGIPVFGFATFFSVSDNYVFFIPFNFIFAIFIAFGLNNFLNKKTFKIISLTVFIIPAFYLLGFKLISLTEKGNNFNLEKSYKGGLAYYMFPWLKKNAGILELTINNTKTPESIDWMKKSANEYIKLKQSQGYSLDEIKKQ